MKLRWLSNFSALLLLIGITAISISLIVVPAGDANRWVVAAIRVPPSSAWLWHKTMAEPTKVTLGMDVHAGDTIVVTGQYLQTGNTLQPALLVLKSANGTYVDVSCVNSELMVPTDAAPWWGKRFYRTFFGQQDVDSNVLLDLHGSKLTTAASRGSRTSGGVFNGLCSRPLPMKAGPDLLAPQRYIPDVPFYVQLDLAAEYLPAELNVHYADGSISESVAVHSTGQLILSSSLMRENATALHIKTVDSPAKQLDSLQLEPIVLTLNDSSVESEKSTNNE